MSRMLGLTWRLSERIAALSPSLKTWKIQPSGSGVEMGALCENARPALFAKVGADMSLQVVGALPDNVDEARVRAEWAVVQWAS